MEKIATTVISLIYKVKIIHTSPNIYIHPAVEVNVVTSLAIDFMYQSAKL